jgi:hypothetical protein
MTTTRTSFNEQYLKTPRGRLDKLWQTTTPLMSTAVPVRMLDERECDLHEDVTELKDWADRQHATTGIYPDDEVLNFLVKFS